jgi:hypothetical protein
MPIVLARNTAKIKPFKKRGAFCAISSPIIKKDDSATIKHVKNI